MQETGVQPGDVVLSEDEVGTMVHLLENLLRRRSPGTALQTDAQRTERDCIALAKTVLHARRQRTGFFSPSLLGEPAWDMLLAIYVQPDGLTVSEAVELSGAAPTTALRWLEYLRDQGLVDKKRSSTDRRIWLVSISDKGRSALTKYFIDIPLNALCAA